jgi:multiple sugar transport system permease protein
MMNKSGSSYLVALILGSVSAMASLQVWSLVSTLFNQGYFPQTWGVTALLGGLLGIVWVLSAESIKKFNYRLFILYPWIFGILFGLIWIFVVPTGGLLTTVLALLAWGVCGRLISGGLAEVVKAGYRKEYGVLIFAKVIRAGGLIFFVSIVLFPFLFMLSSSFKSRAEFLQDPLNLGIRLNQPIADLFRGFTEVLTRFSFGQYIINSTIIALATVVVALIPAILGAYAVTRLNFPGRNLLSRTILLIYMFPAIVLVIPLYSVFTQLGLRDTRFGLLIVYAAMTIPVALYMLRSYFQALPKDLEEAGLIDGLTRIGVILKITIPLSTPAIASVGLYVFMIAWNEFLFAFMFLDSPNIFTLSRGIIMLNDQEVPRQFLMAGATIITIPVMFLFFRFQKLIVGGLTAGGVKG